jgi:hypothetical protein
VTPWLKGNVLGEKLVTLADCLCNKELESTVSSESYFLERWTLLSLVLSQHVKNGREYLAFIFNFWGDSMLLSLHIID